ncbi:WGR domain-containing protein, partial [Streptomyces sp. NPDC002690]
MRRWELVEGTASKFWETGAVGVAVTVRYGRCGSEGRTRTQEYASEEAARAKVRRTIAEKVRKGYEEVAASASAPAAPLSTATAHPRTAPVADVRSGVRGEPALPDEDTFELPLSWRRVLYPRRGGCVRALSRPGEETLAQVGERIAGEAAWIELILTEPGSDPDLVEAARAHLAGSPSPAGAAALAAVVSLGETAPSSWVDTWVAECGLPFAARAAQELQTIKAHSYHALGRRVKGALKRVSLSSSLHWHHGSLNVAARARAHIAAADEPTYRATVAALEAARGDCHQRITAAFLAPSETQWVDALLSEPAVLARWRPGPSGGHAGCAPAPPP